VVSDLSGPDGGVARRTSGEGVQLLGGVAGEPDAGDVPDPAVHTVAAHQVPGGDRVHDAVRGRDQSRVTPGKSTP